MPVYRSGTSAEINHERLGGLRREIYFKREFRRVAGERSTDPLQTRVSPR
ncbi:unnamed protein product [Ectocarpus sp. CCAP 1310/34]|nr:unnamed protein product [Ectocarpus sp. CCAP 1310/34]